MHWNLEQILWALIVAAHLVLLIVLLGRDRAARFPWFTAAIALATARLIADHLLHGKVTSIAFYWQSYLGMAFDALIELLVLIELTRTVFATGSAGVKLRWRGWTGWVIVLVDVNAAILWAWGRPWPTWQDLHSEPGQFALLLTVVIALKAALFASMLAVEVGLLTLVFGKRFGFSWRSHARQIALGLSTSAAAILSVQAIEDLIRRNVHFNTAQERAALALRLGHLFPNLENARDTLWLIVLLWWIIWLWRDERGYPSGDIAEAPVLISSIPASTIVIPDELEEPNSAPS